MTTTPHLDDLVRRYRTALAEAIQEITDYADLRRQLLAREPNPAKQLVTIRDHPEFKESREEFSWAAERVHLFATAIQTEIALRDLP